MFPTGHQHLTRKIQYLAIQLAFRGGSVACVKEHVVVDANIRIVRMVPMAQVLASVSTANGIYAVLKIQLFLLNLAILMMSS
mmetsp:Transcript_3311/g.3988  ORF Transcript_3311/g.3988 Transcript_3311/m.3988 type:complete len:82 (+) Transcript_3311:53-298(+)